MHVCEILKKNGTDEPFCIAEIETQMQRMDMWIQWERGGWDKLEDED